jgi:hypothetical protein
MNNQAQPTATRVRPRETAKETIDNFFAPIGNTKPYFKAAFQGFAGSGKTFTAAQVAVGLHKRIGSKKPIVIFDTEQASKFLKPLFAEAGIEVLVRESKSLADLRQTMEKMRSGISDILLIDSISHVWEGFLQAYAEKVHRTRLEFQDWGIIKPTWKREFSDPFVSDGYHAIFTGRAGYEYDNEKNADTGKREIFKSGIKMKVEGETAYEPDVLVLMERFEEVLGKDKKIYRQATVIKDRSTLIDGKVFMNPTYKDFEPVIENMLENPAERDQEDETDSTGLFRTEEDKYQYINDKKICLEEIEGQLVKAWPSTGAADKKTKMDVLEQIFGTRSWLAVEQKGLDALKKGLSEIKQIVEVEVKKQFPDVPPVKEGGSEAAKKIRAGIEKTKGKKE